MTSKLTFVHALSPLHPGTGQGIGVIDLPVAREQATGLPYLPGSSLKGVLRDRCMDVNEKACKKVFGPEAIVGDENDHAGAAHFSDQRLLLLPVRSLRGTFAWVTSPYLLHRLCRDAANGLNVKLPQSVPVPEENQALVATSKSDLIFSLDEKKKVLLEELDLTAAANSDVQSWADTLASYLFPDNKAWQQMMVSRFCLVSDNVLNFLQQTAMEVVARIRLKDDTKTVVQGGLWYEEAMPTETVLVGLVLAAPVNATKMSAEEVLDTLDQLTNKTLQFGGNATVGRGLCRVLMV